MSTTSHTSHAPTSHAPTSHDPTSHDPTSPRATCCSGTNAQGQPCGSPARPGSTFCFRHDPERAPAQRPGREVEPPNLQLSGPITDARSLRELLAGMIHYAATSPAPDLARVHAISAIAGPLLRSFEKQELEQQLALAQAQLRASEEDLRRAKAELAAQQSRLTPPATQELAAERKRAHELQGALTASEGDRRKLERDLEQARQELASRTGDLTATNREHEELDRALKDTTLVDRLCLSCIHTLRDRRILGPPAHEDDPDWNWPPKH